MTATRENTDRPARFPRLTGLVTPFLEQTFVDRRWLRLVPIPLTVTTLALHRGPYPVPGGYFTTYALVAIVCAAGVTLLLPFERLAPASLVVLSIAGSLLTTAIHVGWTIALPYLAVSIAARRYPVRVSGIVALVAVASVLLSWVSITARPVGVVGELGILAAILLGSVARRSHGEQLEQAELALAREQAAAEEHARAAALAERARIAREMHDVLAHSLAALSLTLQGARLVLVRDKASTAAIEQVQRAQRLAAQGLVEARRAVATLRDEPVPAARGIADLVTNVRQGVGVPAEFDLVGAPRELPPAAEEALHRTVQEALSNATKHAPNAPIRVRLEYRDDGHTEVTISDHPGRRPPGEAPGGYGLTGMRERAELIGGELCVGPTDDGWRVRLVVPS